MVKKSGIKHNRPFRDFQPVLWVPPGSKKKNPDTPIYSVTRDHGINGSYRLHNLNDHINTGRSLIEKVVIEYRIGNISYNLFTVGDFFDVDYPINEKAEGNIMGDIAERISRRITKYFLKHHSRQGRTGGIFDKRFDSKKRDNFIVNHTDKYVLKIQRYPNLVILKKTGTGNYGYDNIKELDGLFDYRYKRQHHILVLESKLDKINITRRDLIKNLFTPLRQFFKDAQFSYILFSDKHALYKKKNMKKLRQLKHRPLGIYNTLKTNNIGVLYFTFNESREDFERMKNHLIMQYRSVVRLDVQFFGKMVLSDRKIVIFDEGETPRIKLVKDTKYGMWREVKFYHKKKK
jgi:hypothetical protein